jgi:hypothetical protein
MKWEQRQLKKYIVFKWHDQYPGGGCFGDYSGDFDTLDECITHLNEYGYIDGSEIVDRDTWATLEPLYYTGTGYRLEEY